MPKLRRIPNTLLLVAVIAACGPKTGNRATRSGATAGRGHPVASPSPTPVAWAADAKALVDVGLGSARVAWDDPPVRPGERLTWHTFGDPATPWREVRVVHDASAPDRWQISGGTLTLDVTLSADRRFARSIARLEAKPAVLDSAGAAAVYSAPSFVDDTSFTQEGGVMLGNEVVRVPAGAFRARHGTVKREGFVWHFYLARSVPGGVVKMEKFADGAESAALVMELEEFTRLKTDAPSAP